jgi:soluble lytic murein transglycosylase
VVKREVPRYFSAELTDLPPPYWQALFPRPYWTDLKAYAAQNALDPYLVAALVRQESAFNPSAISHANAVGLMQLLPSTGRLVARDLKIRRFNPAMLTIPATNLRMGTKYFKGMVTQFGAVEYALAAYNAGSDRVTDWQGTGKYRDIAEFVESIPFTETREYVQAIQRNANVYRQLYGAL